MDFKELLIKILSEVKKDEITIFTEPNEDNEILNKSKIEIIKIYLKRIWEGWENIILKQVIVQVKC